MTREVYDADKHPLVSVTMLVYNHEKWLAKAIESVMMQKTNFRFNLIIGEDCSTDGSREIVKMYQRKYPDSIIALLNEHNLGMKGNVENVGRYVYGKYVACCEGDDYWTDPHKLSKQVEFMETHPEYSAIYHSTEIVDGDGNPMRIPGIGFVYEDDSDLSWELAAELMLAGQVASSLVRNPRYFADPYLLEKSKHLSVLHGDHVGNLLYMSYGKIRRCHVPVSAYRRTYEGSSFNALSLGYDMHYYDYVGVLEAARYLNLFAPLHIDNRKIAYRRLLNFWRNVFDGKRGKIKNIYIMLRYRPSLFLGFSASMLLAYVIGPSLRSGWLISALKRVEPALDTYKVSSYVIFGTGEIGIQCMKFFEAMGWRNRIGAFWDNDRKKVGGLLEHIPILLPGNGISQSTDVIVASNKYLKEMKKQIQDIKNVNIRRVIGFDEWIEEMIHQARNYSIEIRLMQFLFRYELRWRKAERRGV